VSPILTKAALSPSQDTITSTTFASHVSQRVSSTPLALFLGTRLVIRQLSSQRRHQRLHSSNGHGSGQAEGLPAGSAPPVWRLRFRRPLVRRRATVCRHVEQALVSVSVEGSSRPVPTGGGSNWFVGNADADGVVMIDKRSVLVVESGSSETGRWKPYTTCFVPAITPGGSRSSHLQHTITTQP
jgi:hypothetical protein